MTRRPARDLSQVKLKLYRANEHIETFSADLEAFLKGDPPPFGFRTEETPGAGKAVEYVLRAIVREEPPAEFALVIGDAIQNMRAALEYLAYELSSPRARKSKTTFPIYSDECEFKVRGTPMIKTMSADERAFIERMQPYNASKMPSNNPLAILRKLSNLDKHQLLLPMIAAVSASDSWVASTNAEIDFTFIEAGPVKHDAEIMAFTATPKNPAMDMEVDTKSGLQVEIQNTGIVGFQISALDLLQMILHHIGWHIEWCLERGILPRTWAEVEAVQ